MSSSLSRHRERLWRRDNRCYWCGKPTRLLSIVRGRRPDDMATIDHLFSRLDKDRKDINRTAEVQGYSGGVFEGRRVLSCYACNHSRGRLECKMTRLREQRAATINGLASKGRRHDGRTLCECGYQERRRRLKALKYRIDEGGISGLISVMGLPLREVQ